jgi:alpha/beta superfamily hydrolase
MTPDKLVCFAHGKESGPWGTKITYLAELAKTRGFQVMSPDYSHTMDPRQRVAELHTLAPSARTLVLAGSSMGAYVSALACTALKPTALFLMAPALYFPGFDEEPEDIPALCSVVHGWDDEVVPRERALRFAERQRAELHLLASEHSLNDRLPELGVLFADLLDRAAQASRP